MENYYHVIQEVNIFEIASYGYYTNRCEAEKEVARLQRFYEDSYFYVYTSSSRKEPEFVTI
jgi:hypothetical protein